MPQDEEVLDLGDTKSARLKTPSTSLVIKDDQAELIYSFFAAHKLGNAFHMSDWTPEMCVETLVDIARNSPDIKARLDAIKYLDEKAKQSLMLSGRMEEISRSITKTLPDGTKAEMTAKSLSRLSSSKVLESLEIEAIPNNVTIEMEEPHDSQPDTRESRAGIRRTDSRDPVCEYEPLPGPEPSPPTGAGIQGDEPSSYSDEPEGDSERDRESSHPAPEGIPRPRTGPISVQSYLHSPGTLEPAGIRDSIFDLVEQPVDPGVKAASLESVASTPSIKDDEDTIADETFRGHTPPSVDTGTGLASHND